MTETPFTTRRQFSLLVLLVTVTVVVVLVYVAWQIWKPIPVRPRSNSLLLSVAFSGGGLHRSSTAIENYSDKAFSGGILAIKDGGLVNSQAFSVKPDGFIHIEWVWQVTSFQGKVLLDLKQEIEQATSGNWIPTERHHDFSNSGNEWIYEEREMILDNVKHNYKIIICHDYNKALAKYSLYDPQLHPGQAMSPAVEVPAQPGK